MIVLLIFAYGCTTRTPSVDPEQRAPEKIYKGFSGLEMAFAKGLPPDKIYDTTPLDLLIDLENKGTFDLTGRCELYLHGYDDNIIRGNKSTGASVFSLTSTESFDAIDVGPNPEYNWLHDNDYDNNGYDPDSSVADLGVPTGDILWDGTGVGNVFEEPDAGATFPPLLPASSWPTGLQRLYARVLNLFIDLLA